MAVQLTPAMAQYEAVYRLAAALRQYGFQRLYQAHDGGVSVLSVTAGLTVWCLRGTFCWVAGSRRWMQRAHAPEATALIIARQRGHAPP
jgi:uncharacterized iron-regulated membrane protein